MRLFRIHLNPRCREARRDLADPYQMHATLCRAFFPPEARSTPGSLLWRLEPETDHEGLARVLVQCRETPDWLRIVPPEWLARTEPGLNLEQRLALDRSCAGRVFRFRIRANPCVTKNGKRLGLFDQSAQQAWLSRKGDQHGFSIAPLSGRTSPDLRITQGQMLTGRQYSGNAIRVFSVLYEGRLAVTDVEKFRTAISSGIGHAKAMGLGLLSVVPV